MLTSLEKKGERKMKRVFAAIIIGILCLSTFSALTPVLNKARAYPTYQVFFEESGVGNPQQVWSVTLSGYGKRYSNDPGNTIYTIIFTGVPNGGPYTFTVTPPSDFVAQPASDTITVNGGNVHKSITFTPAPPQTYAVTIAAHCYTENTYVNVPITKDGQSNFGSPHTYSGLTGSHSFAIPNTDTTGHPFKQWSTGQTSPTITVSSGGTYTAFYQASVSTTYTVNLASNTGGTVTYQCSYGSGTIPSGQSINLQVALGTLISLTAHPDSHYTFGGWSTSGYVYVSNGLSATATLTVNGKGQVAAGFMLLMNLGVSISPSSATIQAGNSVQFAASVSGGSGTYTHYVWHWVQYGTANHGSHDSGSTHAYTFMPSQVGGYGVYVVITDSSSNTAQSLSSSVTVQSTSPPSTSNLQVLLYDQQSGNPIQGATVTMTSVPDGQSFLSGTTDSLGQYTFQNIQTGSYSVLATASSHSPGTGSATTQTSQTAEITIILAGATPPSTNETIYIRADGSIDPSTAPIQRNGNVFSLTGNIESTADGIVIEGNDVVLDGAGYTIHGAGNGNGTFAFQKNNITIRALRVTGFYYGIYLHTCSCCNIARNNVTANEGHGIVLQASNSSVVTENIVSANMYGVLLYVSSNNNSVTHNSVNANWAYGIRVEGQWGSSSNNNIESNDVVNNNIAISLYIFCPSNLIFDNNVADNNVGIHSISSSGSKIFHNNFTGARQIQAWIDNVSSNLWDNGYPSGGNYWSDYTGVDSKSGPNQDQLGDDGIGDTPYPIDSDNTDHYPLMWPWGSPAPPTYSVTITAHCNTEGVDINVPIKEDGSSSSFNTTHTFVGLTGTHSFTVPSTDASGHAFKQWSTGQTNTTVTISSAGSLIAYYQAATPPVQGTVYIRPDGSVDPPTAPISTTDGVTYTLTDSILSHPTFSGIVVERSSIVINGNGYTLQASGLLGDGIVLTSVSSVTIQNMKVTGFWAGILLDSSSSNTVSGNSLTGNSIGLYAMHSSNNNKISGNNLAGDSTGIDFWGCSDNDVRGNSIVENSYAGIWLDNCGWPLPGGNTFSGNNISSNYYGIVLDESPNNTLSGNSICGNRKYGIYLYSNSSELVVSGNDMTGNSLCAIYLNSSSYNSISGNNMTENGVGITLTSSASNVIYHNNFIRNPVQASVDSTSLDNIWDANYPSAGNYWSDYTGVDLKSGPSQSLLGSDGIGDTAYVIDNQNIDHYPLIRGSIPPPTFSVTIDAHCNTETRDISVNIVKDSLSTGHSTSYTFTGLSGSPTFTVPNTDSNGHPFKNWDNNLDKTSPTIEVTSAGTHTAYYEAIAYPPLNVVATPTILGVILTWLPPAPSSQVQGYYIYRGTSPDFVPWGLQPYATRDKNALRYTDSPLTENTIYYYQIVACFTQGCGIPSTIVGCARTESLRGISNTITGVTTLNSDELFGRFTIQQNFYLYTKDAQNNPVMYWCQNVVDLPASEQGRRSLTARKSGQMWIWDASSGALVAMSLPYFLLPGADVPDTFEFESKIVGSLLVMKNTLASWAFGLPPGISYPWPFNDIPPLSSDAYIAFNEASLVVVGSGNGADIVFSSGDGQVSSQTMIGSAWFSALNSPAENTHTAETSHGLEWYVMGHIATYWHQDGATKRGVFFRPDFNSPVTGAVQVTSLGQRANSLTFSARCPVYLGLYDDQGRHVGYNESSRTVDFEMDNVAWVSNQTLLVFDPVGTYSLEVTGTDNGTFTLETSWQDTTGANSIISNITGTIAQDETQSHTFGSNPNVALMNVQSKTVLGQGFELQVNATAADLSGVSATFDVALYANGTLIDTQNALDISGWDSTTVCFAWNTTGFAYGNYTLGGRIGNSYTESWVIVSMLGDITGSTGWPEEAPEPLTTYLSKHSLHL